MMRDQSRVTGLRPRRGTVRNSPKVAIGTSANSLSAKKYCTCRLIQRVVIADKARRSLDAGTAAGS